MEWHHKGTSKEGVFQTVISVNTFDTYGMSEQDKREYISNMIELSVIKLRKLMRREVEKEFFK